MQHKFIQKETGEKNNLKQNSWVRYSFDRNWTKSVNSTWSFFPLTALN